MGHEYNEDSLIEQTVMDIFKNELNWEVYNAFKNETFGENGSLGRNTELDVILKHKLLESLKHLNPALPDEAYNKAVEIITSETSYLNLSDINKEKYKLFIEGVKVNYKDQKGINVKNKTLRIFDFNNPHNNQFLAVQQLWVQGKTYRRRPDIIGFVNGIPLLFIELKAVHKNLRSAYDGNLKDYKDTITRLFYYNAFILLSNGAETKIGSITGRYEHFNEWKRITEDEEGIISLDTALKGICDKNRFMDLFENFILFDDSLGRTIKLIARNHQFIGVNNAIESVKNTNQKSGKLGVFWHTQGSGKSYSMIFFCQKIHRKLKGSYSFVIVTDREELDKQIYGTFTGTGALTELNVRATSGLNLVEMLKENHRYVFTLIHKFNSSEIITRRDNVIVISDEAHRTQQGMLALNMRNAMPNASFIGFTGTPLIKQGDEITREIFGDYVSTYNFKRSIEDNSTVPLYYENRGEFLKLDNPTINENMRNVIEESELDLNQAEKLERLFYRDYPILTAKKRLRAIAEDIVWHFNNRGYKGKAMVVCLDKITAVRMYEYITEYWSYYSEKLKKELKNADDEQDLIEKQKEIDWINETEIAVVISEEQNEIEKFKKWGLKIEPHRIKMKQRDLERDFKDDNHPFRLVIVCAMWITGFDVQSLSTLYLDKPLKGHTLMQTIARANRVYYEKNNGLIVDYIETYKSLLDALAIYGDPGKSENDTPPVGELERLVKELEEYLNLINEYFLSINFNLNSIIEAENNLYKIKAIDDGVNLICRNDVTKKRFQILSNGFFVKFQALTPNKLVMPFVPQKAAIQVLFNKIESAIQSTDITEIIKKLQDVVDESIIVVKEPTFDYGKQFDISNINFNELANKFKKNPHKNVVVQQLKNAVEKKLEILMKQNPFRADFQKKYNEIIDKYNKGKDEAEIMDAFDQLLELLESLGIEEQRAIREGLNEEQMTIFDILNKPDLSKKEKELVKSVAVELLEKLKSEKLKIENWRDKAQIAAAVRMEIMNKLYSKMPFPTYIDEDLNKLTNNVYWYVWNAYPKVN